MSFLVFLLVHDSPSAAAAAKADAAEAPAVPEPAEGEQLSGLAEWERVGWLIAGGLRCDRGWGYQPLKWITTDDYTCVYGSICILQISGLLFDMGPGDQMRSLEIATGSLLLVIPSVVDSISTNQPIQPTNPGN